MRRPAPGSDIVFYVRGASDSAHRSFEKEFCWPMSLGEAEQAVRSPSEIAEAIRGLPSAGWLRLKKIARAFARACPMEADDLLQEAYTRALAGSRRCPRSVDVIRFLAEAMRSIASDSVKEQLRVEAAKARRPELLSVPSHDDADDDPLTRAVPTPEDIVGCEEAAAKFKAAILALFVDDLIAQTIVEGDWDEMDAEEIRTLTDIDKVGYASKRRFIRRRIDQAFPDGWKP
jgi:DNA-directed RNA polymerase specialized sigma24 family protein